MSEPDQHFFELQNNSSEVQYEYILDTHGEDDSTQVLSNVVCSDSSSAYLINGQYFIADENNETFLLQEGDSLGSNPNENFSNEFSNTDEVIQYFEEESPDGQIIYFTNTCSQQLQVGDESNFESNTIENTDGNFYSYKTYKLENGFNFEAAQQAQLFEEPQESQEEYLEINGDFSDNVHYVLEDGQLCLFDPKTETGGLHNLLEEENKEIDLSQITGRNLITGQTVALHTYMEKLKHKNNQIQWGQVLDKSTNAKTPELFENPSDTLQNLVDRKISLGRTKSGKKIVGKILHVEKKPKEDVKDEPKVLVKKSLVARDNFEELSKTLGGIMEMETIRKKLAEKNIVVKLVEKIVDDEEDYRNVSYSYGFMMEKLTDDGPKWKFIPDQDTQDALLYGQNTDKNPKYPITTSLTVVTVFNKKTNSKSIRVNLNPTPGNLCSICAQLFKTNHQLRLHMIRAHSTDLNKKSCEICSEIFVDFEKLQQHKYVHVEEGKLFMCGECNKCFTTPMRLKRHESAHNVFVKPMKCTVCKMRCSSMWMLKKHLLSHRSVKPYECDVCHRKFALQHLLIAHSRSHLPKVLFTCTVCLRPFSRHSNLIRHMAIHKGTGELYKCDICLSSFNYISSLTRHMVQTHVQHRPNMVLA